MEVRVQPWDRRRDLVGPMRESLRRFRERTGLDLT
jgi:hypothetical protein